MRTLMLAKITLSTALLVVLGGCRSTARQGELAGADRALDTANAGQTSSAAASQDSAAIVQLHRQWIRAFQQHDPKLLDAVLADEFVAYFPEAVTREQYMEALKDTSVKVESVADDELRVRMLGSAGDVALLAGLVTQKGSQQGQADSGQNRYTEVWVKRGGRWQCLVDHVQRVAPKS